MRIFFRHDSTSSFAMLETLEEWGLAVESRDSNVESTTNFVFAGVEFMLTYDVASASNRAIYPFVIESLLDNDGAGTERTSHATVSLHDLLKRHLLDLELESDA